MSNYNKNPTGRLTDADIDPLSGVELAVDDLTFMKRGKSASEMFAGFTPTPEQLDAMNSGITADDVDQIGINETNISSLQDHIKFDSSSKTYYLQQTQPSSPAEGDIWIG